jgi:hypothetical protein
MRNWFAKWTMGHICYLVLTMCFVLVAAFMLFLQKRVEPDPEIVIQSQRFKFVQIDLNIHIGPMYLMKDTQTNREYMVNGNWITELHRTPLTAK